MLFQILTSSSELNEISDFKYIYNLAVCTKCNMFIALKSTNKLYGSNPESGIIHEVDIPFLLNSDIEFRVIKGLYESAIEKYESFFIPEAYPWIIIPTVYWDMYRNGDIVSIYSNDTDYLLYDRNTNQLLDQVQMHPVLYSFERTVFLNHIESYLRRLPVLGYPITIHGIHNDPTVKKVFTGKTTDGATLCTLTEGNLTVSVFLFKGIFNMAKDDTLDVDIQFDKFNSREFMATFKPIKKKNPLKSSKYGVPFREVIRVMYIDVMR